MREERSGSGDAARSQAACLGDTLARLKADGFSVAHVGIFDLDASFRERRLALEDVASVCDDGGTFVNVLMLWDTAERVFAPGPYVGEAIAVDPA